MTKKAGPKPRIEGADGARNNDADRMDEPREPAARPAETAGRAKEGPQAGAAARPGAAPSATPPVGGPSSLPRGPLGWLSQTFPGHEHAILGGLCGVLAAVLIFVVGFWQTLFVALLAVVGVALGQYLDGDPKLVNLVRRLISEGRGSEG